MDPSEVVGRFTEAINARDLDALAGLMTHDHRFVDPDDNVVDGKAACADAWRGFFESFPDYVNIFASVEGRGDAVVVVQGRSRCSEPALDGPALWSADVVDDLVGEWRVYDDTAENRRRLGLT